MWNPFARSYSAQDKATMEFLKDMHIFSCLSDEELFLFLPSLYLRSYTKEEVVFFRNDPSQALYMIRKGFVKIELDIGERFEVIGRLQAGDFFGENCLIQNSQRLYNAIADEVGTELYILPLGNIFELFDEYPRIKSRMYEALAQYQYKNIQTIFEAYRENFGFFELGKAYLASKNVV